MKKLAHHIKIFIAFILIQGCLVGCAGFGVFASNDPLTKLDDANHLYSQQGRALMAEQLIFEAIEIYNERGDNQGLGHAHREYADFLLSPSIVRWEKFYRDNGFRDKSITFDNRKQMSNEYLKKAMTFYTRAEPQLISSKKYDALTNLYYNMAMVSGRLHDNKQKCAYLDSAIAAYEENMKANPGAKPNAPQGYNSPKEFLESLKEN